MEVPGRDVTADALGPEDPTPGAEPAAREETREPSDSSGDADDREGGVGEKLREAAEKVKDAVTPDR